MNLLIWACLALAAWPSTFALYYTRTKEVFEPPTKDNRNNSYFGYSITYDEMNKKLIISAPRISDIGEVYDCNIEDQKCARISRDIIKRDPGRDGFNYTHDFWFGATVKAGRKNVLMCAPRYTERDIRFDAYVTHGRCYSYEKNALTEKRIINGDERIQDSPSPMEATMDSFGWSIDVASDDSVIVGGPGMFRGRAMIYSGSQPNGVPKFIKKSGSATKFNIGYAVASGAFIHAESMSYAVGTPYGPGEVKFYKVNSYGTYLRILDKTVDTELIGSMFGAVLCAANLLGIRTDLLVGAPTYAEKNTYNMGAVYVFLAKTRKQPPKFHRRIVGQTSGSMFGSAIVNVEDLNGDSKHDIAIGAPFEKNGHGVVYIYSGADLISEQTDRDLKWLQKIEPEPSYSESFGMSLSPLLDYDDNGCKELAIGSPYKDTVVVFRCMAAVVVTTSAIFPKLQGRTSSGKEEFEFDVYLTVTYQRLPKLVTARISTTVEMIHASAKLLDTDAKGHFTFNTVLEHNKTEYPNKVRFLLPLEGKYGTEIRYTISSELLDDPRNLADFNRSRVTLSDRSVLTMQGSLWAAECAGNKTCVPKLELKPKITLHNDDDPYIIGSSEIEIMQITMYNDGEVAYDSCVRVHIDGVNVRKSGGCVYESLTDGNRQGLRCEPQKPLWNKNSWTTGLIELEMIHLTNLDKSINITMVIYNRCNDNETVTPHKMISIPVRADPSGITIKGETDIGTVIKMMEKDIKENGKTLKHIYTIKNSGLTNWVGGLSFNVTLQKLPFVTYDSVTVYFSKMKIYTPCSSELQNTTSVTYTCLVESLEKNVDFAKILIPMNILPKTLEGLLDEDKNVTIMSAVQLELTDYDYYTAESITSILTLQEAEVPFETIIIAVVVGLCILIIIALILYRIGFLQRKRREELQRLRKSVKRQTILRRSTMPSQNSTAEDRKQILEGMKEEDEHDHPPNLI